MYLDITVTPQVERQRRLERIKQKQSQLQELILQVQLKAVLLWLNLYCVFYSKAKPSVSFLFLLCFCFTLKCLINVSACYEMCYTDRVDILSAANSLQEPGTAQPSDGTADQPAATAQLGDPSALHHRQHQQEDSHRLQHFQWQVNPKTQRKPIACLTWCGEGVTV